MIKVRSDPHIAPITNSPMTDSVLESDSHLAHTDLMESGSSTDDHTYTQNATASVASTNENITDICDDEEDEEEEDIEWIGVDNISLNTHNNNSQAVESTTITDLVFVSTMDYTMQNLILMLFNNYLCLVTLDNMQIQSTTYYAKRCYSCGWFDLSGSKEFCSDCGHHTLKRVMAKVNGDTLELHYRDRVIHNYKKVHTDNVAMSNNKMN